MDKNFVIAKIKEKGMKVTPQRLAIIDALVDNMLRHPGADLIYKEAKKKARSISLSTVYATLNDLSRFGIIKTLEFDRVENRFECRFEDHINLVCKKCGRISDYKLPISIDQKEISNFTGFSINEVRMEFYGYCQNCAGEE